MSVVLLISAALGGGTPEFKSLSGVVLVGMFCLLGSVESVSDVMLVVPSAAMTETMTTPAEKNILFTTADTSSLSVTTKRNMGF